MTTPELLSYLCSLGVELWREGERLRINAPAGVLTPAMREQVSARKAEILTFLDRASRSLARVSPELPPLVPVPRDSDLPLSFAQQRLWFIDQLQPGSPAYNIPMAFRLPDPLHLGMLSAVLTEIVRRHEALRTTFEMIDGEPVQVITPPGPVSLPVVDLSALPAEARSSEESRLLAVVASRPFDLRRGPLLRSCLLRLKEGGTVVLVMHHIISDGWSVEVLLREIVALYEAFRENRPLPFPDLPLQYADYASWQRQWLRGEVLEAEISHWRERLQGAPPLLELPTDRPRPPVQSFRGASIRFQMPEGLAPALVSLSRDRQATVFMTVLSAFQVLLHRWSGQDDINVGTPIAGRHRPETDGLIGLFVNTLVIRTDLSGDLRFLDLLARVREATLEAYRHQDLPFEKLVEELRPPRSLSQSPLFQVMFTLQNFQKGGVTGPGLPRLGIGTGMAKFDLSAMIAEGPGRFTGGFEYSRDLFDGTTIRRMMEQFGVLLEGIAMFPQARVSELPLLGSAERHQLVREWNDTAARGREDLLHSLFEAQARRTPEDVALICRARRLTYRELDERAGALAGHLSARGVGPEEVVGLCMDRSEDMVAALLGILKAGAAYLPLDPDYPRERLAFMIDDAAVRKVLTRDRFLGVLPLLAGLEVLPLEALRDPVPAVPRRVSSDRLAYLIYTSGSTGRPKGVAISHRSAVALIDWSGEVFGDEEIAGVLASTSINFDLSVFELFVPLSRGGTVVLADDALALIDRPPDGDVTLLNTVPSAMAGLLQAEALPASVRTVNLAGEPLRASLVRQIHRQTSGIRVYNLYGPSEDTTYSTWACIARDFEGEPSIGRPVSATRAFVLDGHGHPVPIGVSGELFLGGAGLARGYLNRPDLTAERFLPDPFSPEPGARMYRTGDSARHRPDGRLEFLGRLDAQVKVRGFRIEPAEIEATLTGHPEIEAAAVVLLACPEDSFELVACVVPEKGSRLVAGQVRKFLAERLPSHMIPSLFTFLEELPLTASGKIDRRAVAALASKAPGDRSDPYVPPASDLERGLAVIWQQVLGRERVGVEDNFFESGGDSLKTIRVVARMQRLGLEASVRDLFRHQTIRALALHCEGRGPVAEAGRPAFEFPVTPAGTGVSRAGLAAAEAALLTHPRIAEAHFLPGKLGGEEVIYAFYRLRTGGAFRERDLYDFCRANVDPSCLPSRFVEILPAPRLAPGEIDSGRLERLLDHEILDLYEFGPSQDWFFAQPWRHPGTWVVVRGRSLGAAVDPGALQEACRALERRHEILDTVFPDPALARVQLIVRPSGPSPLDIHDVSDLTEEEQRYFIARQARAAAGSIRLDRWPLFRFLLFRTEADRSFLLFVCHHLLCDELSIEVLADDLFLLYREIATGRSSPGLLPARNLFRDYVRWLRQLKEEGGMEESLRFWQHDLPAGRPYPRLPVTFADAPNLASLRQRRVIELSAPETERLAAVLFAVAARAVARWSGSDDAILAEIHHGRLASDGLNLERAVGFFAIGTPIRIEAAGSAPFPELVRATAARLGSIPLTTKTYYNCLWREISNHFNFDPAVHKVAVNYFSDPQPSRREGASLQPSLESDDILPSLIELFIASSAEGLRLTISYSRAKFHPEEIEHLAVLLQKGLAEAFGEADPFLSQAIRHLQEDGEALS